MPGGGNFEGCWRLYERIVMDGEIALSSSYSATDVFEVVDWSAEKILNIAEWYCYLRNSDIKITCTLFVMYQYI